MFGEEIAHGTPIRRSHEDQLLDRSRVCQIGLRATGYESDEFDWSREQGWRVVQASEIWYKSLAPLMEEVRAQMGDGPVYLTFDIDSFASGYAPGTGTAEPGGPTSHQGIELIRGLAGLNIVGCDLVEVSPLRSDRCNRCPRRQHSVRNALRIARGQGASLTSPA
ncbi:UNVERIFIED_CONTAM: hypothetical protein GTU68_001825 [Idotea baltica]|nr:hypothetical protein [Idotea baltica]